MANYIVSGTGTITIVLNKRSYSVAPDHPKYQEFVDAIKSNTHTELDLFHLLHPKEAGLDPAKVAEASGGEIELVNGVVYYLGQPLHSALAGRIKDMLTQGFSVTPMLAFLKNLMENPSSRAVQEGYSFLEHHALPITEDGHFLAYKSVKDDYTDKYSGTIKNTVGTTISVPRNTVDDDCHRTCSHGLHVGALEYSGPNGWYHSAGDRIVICKVNPRDIVSVPTDHNATKLRVCAYTVVDEYDAPMDKAPVYSSEADPVDSDDLDFTEEDTAYDEGYEAFNNQDSDNPYSYFGEARQWEEWQDGWNTARYDSTVNKRCDNCGDCSCDSY